MNGDPSHDFDFFFGSWRVRHRRLKERLADCTVWEEFSGTCTTSATLGGLGNFDDNVLDLPAGTYRAMTVRAFDPTSKTWAIWWLDGRKPQHFDVPMIGSFADGVGTFLADDTFDGRPIKVRFLWSQITPSSCRWEQAFCDEGSKVWETNWVMEFSRSA